MPTTSSRLWAYYLAFIGICAQIGASFPSLQLWYKHRGLLEHEVAMVNMASTISALVMQQVWGYVADVVLNRRTMMLLLIGPTALIVSCFYLLPHGVGAIGLLSSYLLLSLMMGSVYSPQAQLLNGLAFSDPLAERHFLRMRALGSLAFVVTNIVTGYYVTHSSIGDRAAWPIFLGMTFVTLTGVYAIPRPVYTRTAPPIPADVKEAIDSGLAPSVAAMRLGLDDSHPDRQAPGRHEAFKNLSFLQVQMLLLKNVTIRRTLILSLLYQVPFATAFNVLQIFLIRERGFGDDVVGWSYSLGAFVEIPCILASGLIVKRFGALPILALACMGNSVRWFAMAEATAEWQLVGISLLHTITFGLFYPCIVHVLNQHADPRLKSSAQTMIGFVYISMSNLSANALVIILLKYWQLSLTDSVRLCGWLALIALAYALWLILTEIRSRRGATPSVQPAAA